MAIRIESWLIGIALFSLVVTVLMGAVGNLSAEYANMGYPQNLDTSQTTIFDKSAEINELTEELQNQITATSSNPISIAYTFLYVGWSALLLTIKSLVFGSSLVMATATVLGLPPAIAAFIIVGITLSLIFTIVYIAFRVGSFV